MQLSALSASDAVELAYRQARCKESAEVVGGGGKLESIENYNEDERKAEQGRA